MYISNLHRSFINLPLIGVNHCISVPQAKSFFTIYNFFHLILIQIFYACVMHLHISSTATNKLLISFSSCIAADKNGVTLNGGGGCVLYTKQEWLKKHQ